MFSFNIVTTYLCLCNHNTSILIRRPQNTCTNTLHILKITWILDYYRELYYGDGITHLTVWIFFSARNIATVSKIQQFSLAKFRLFNNSLKVSHNASPVTPINYWRNCTEGVWWPCYFRSDIWFKDDLWEASSLSFQSSFAMTWYLEEVLASVSW